MLRSFKTAALTFCLTLFVLSIGEFAARSSGAVMAAEKSTKTLTLKTRTREETESSSRRYRTLTKNVQWEPKRTAIVVCDMWDLHHCLNATRRGAEIAPRMDRLLKNARDRGVTIIHAPSSCMPAYKNHPARENAQRVPRSGNLPQDIGKWCYRIDSEHEDAYPIDQSDGGEDDDLEEHRQWAQLLKSMGRNPSAPWKSQTGKLTIHDTDFISDHGEEIWSILEQRRIDNVILVGVHTNMCVLGRPFGLRQMAKNGKNVVLMRDMTDTMYNPARRPYVSHFSGTDLIVEYIEKFVCPTVTSVDLLGGKPFRFQHDKRPHLAIVMAEQEYNTNQTLPAFAQEHLGKDFRVSLVFANPNDRNDIPGLEVLNEADVALISVRRRVLTKAQLDIVRKFVSDGKPLVGIRTASHAFSLYGGKEPPQGHDSWTTFDSEVFGGNYKGHHGNSRKPAVRPASAADGHPILRGVEPAELRGNGSLYKVSPLATSTRPLLVGSIPEHPAEPVAWINVRRDGGRVFYTSLGHPDDFKLPAFNQLLLNGITWAARMPVAR